MRKGAKVGCVRVLQVVGFPSGNCHSLFNMLSVNDLVSESKSLFGMWPCWFS